MLQSNLMEDLEKFEKWLKNNTRYTERTVNNIKCRVNRANSILPIINDEYYLYKLMKKLVESDISSSVKSQIKKAVNLYFTFIGEAER